MSNLITVISDTLRPYANSIMGLFIFFIFIAVGYYSYYKFYIPYIEKKKYSDVANINNRKKIILGKQRKIMFCTIYKIAQNTLIIFKYR